MPRPAALIGVIAAAAFLGVVGYGYVAAIDGAPSGTRPGAADVLARGKVIYGAECASCHGAELQGQPNWRTANPDGTLPAPPHDATGHTWHHPDQVLFKITRDGGAAGAPPGFKSAMPAFGGKLADADIWAVLSYIKSRWPTEIQRRHTDMSRLAG